MDTDEERVKMELQNAERQIREKIANEKIEAERIAKEKAEAERIAKQKAEAERLAKFKAEAERISKEKAEAERISKEKAEAERIAKEKAEAEKKIKNTPEPVSPVNPFMKTDPVLKLIFEIIYDRNASMEYMMLREHYAEHPEDFRMLGTDHHSNDDLNPHVSFEVKRTFTLRTLNGEMKKTWIKVYHLYYTPLIGGNRQWTYLTQVDREKQTYMVAQFH